MRFENYINEESNILGFIYLTDSLNEVSDDFIIKLQKLGKKVGIKVTKSETFHRHLKKAGKGVLNLMKLVSEYAVHADIMDKSALVQLENDMKKQLNKVHKEDLMDFLVNLDKTFLGITSIPRHILQNILGVNMTTYHNWVSDKDYVHRELIKIITTLERMGDNDDALIAKRILQNVTGEKA